MHFTTIATIIIIVCNSNGYLINNNLVKKINLDCILRDVASGYVILIGDKGSLGYYSVPLVRFSGINLRENIAKLESKPSIYIFELLDPDSLDYALEVLVNSEIFKPAQFFLLYDSKVNISELVDVLWKFKWVCALFNMVHSVKCVF